MARFVLGVAVLALGCLCAPQSAQAQRKYSVGGIVTAPIDETGRAVLTPGGGLTTNMYVPMRGEHDWQQLFVLGFDFITLGAEDNVNFTEGFGDNQVVNGADLYFVRPGMGWRWGSADLQWFADLTGVIGYGVTKFSPNPAGFNPAQRQFTVGELVDDSFMGGFSVASGVEFSLFGGTMGKVGAGYTNVFNTLFTNEQRHDGFFNAFLEIEFGPPARVIRP